jgi:predicted P-loop ATPase
MMEITDTITRNYEQRKQYFLMPVREMKQFVANTFEVRHNVITDVYEFRRKKDDELWRPLDERGFNTIACGIEEANIFCLDSRIKHWLRSDFAQDYHPVRQWLDTVRGQWDGVDRTEDLFSRISPYRYCREMGRIWLRSVVSQWLGYDTKHANAVMLLLVSPQQGLHKSTFVRELLPPELRDYYTDDFSLSAKGNAQRKLVEFAIVNIDEFDKENPKKMPELKTLMQTMKPSFIGSYKKNFNRLPRIASFVGTSNSRQLLYDHTGSRRFLILEPKEMIRTGGIDYVQLYAQMIHEVEAGLPTYFTKAQEREMQRRNQRYTVKDEVETLFSTFFRVPRNNKEGELITAEEVLNKLSAQDHHVVRHLSPSTLGQRLITMGLTPRHTRRGNAYRLVVL